MKIEMRLSHKNGKTRMRLEHRHKLRWALVGVCLAAVLFAAVTGIAADRVFSQAELIGDARQLSAILEENHPDPYFRGGGKVAFHRRFQELLASIPADGMAVEAFIDLLLPFVAAVGDGHTTVWDWEAVQLSAALPGGVPLRFEVVEQSLYVAAVPLARDLELIGSILLSVEGVSVDELRARQRRRRAVDNEYGELRWLIDGLWYGPRLTELVPEWTDQTTVRATLQHSDGTIADHEFRTPVYSSSLRRPAETVAIPEPGPSGFGTGFLDDEGRVAFLRVDDMTGYREALGRTGPTSDQEIPNDVLAATPSATEVFRQLVIDMKEAGTETLLIDLRRDHGGASLMSDILVYFLYGKDVLLDVIVEPILNGGGQIERLGPLEMKYYAPDELAKLSAQHGFPLQTGDFNTAGHHDFYAAYAAALGLTLEELVEQQGQLHLAGQYDDVRVFSNEFASGEYAGYCTPENVIVLVSAHTYSSGYTMMRYLSSAGATLIGTPSAQAANCIGEGLSWELGHTGIRGLVAHNIYAHCPDDPERGRVWPVDVPLTYEYLASTGFDPSAGLLLALDWIEAQEEAETVARLEMKVESLREALRIPGLSAAVVKDGELIWAKGFGYANLEDQVEATAETPYGLASVTKPFAAILLMKKLETGELDLDTPVGEFGIDLESEGIITARHLLSHTSEGTPGSHYQYNGWRYAELTTIIEQLYGGSFRRVLRDEILGTLGMNDTALNVGGCGIEYHLSTLATDDPERAFEHVYRSAATPYLYDQFYDVYPAPVPSYANAAAGLISTVVDLARFAAAIEQDALVASETKERMFTPTRLTSGEVGPYGLGWFTETYGETELIWHYGYGAYSSLFLMAPDEGLTFIVLANTQNLSRPFGLGREDASVLASPLALSFFKEFLVQPEFEEPLPEIDWAADTHAVVEQLGEISDEDLRDLYERELWAYRKLYAGVGRKDVSFGLRGVYAQAFGGSEVSRGDLYEVELPGPRPPEAAPVALTDAEAARWIGRYRLRPEDAASGLPLEIEIGVYGDRILAISGDDDCQELLPLSPVRAVAAENPDLFLLAEGAEGPFTGAVAEYGGALMGTYERIVASENEEKNE